MLSWDSPDRFSQVPDWSVGARCPQSPRRAGTLHLLVASRSVMASPLSEGWPLGLRNEAESGSRLRITADTFAARRASTTGCPSAAPSATWRTSTYHGKFLSFYRSTRLRLGHQRTQSFPILQFRSRAAVRNLVFVDRALPSAASASGHVSTQFTSLILARTPPFLRGPQALCGLCVEMRRRTASTQRQQSRRAENREETLQFESGK